MYIEKDMEDFSTSASVLGLWFQTELKVGIMNCALRVKICFWYQTQGWRTVLVLSYKSIYIQKK